LTRSAALLPIGPYHPAFIEGEFLRLWVRGERVVGAEIKLGYNHRGIMKLMEQRTFHQNIFLAERVCGICNTAHAICYCTAVERLLGISPPHRAQLLRILLAELERIHSHLLLIGLVADLAGFRTLFMYAWKIREHVLDAIERITGSRRHSGMVTIGGVSRPVPGKDLASARRSLLVLAKELPKLLSIMKESTTLKRRCRGVTEVDKQTARKIGFVGPNARASGLKLDVRAAEPYLPYAELDWKPVLGEFGDSFERLIVRAREAYQSLRTALICIKRLLSESGPLTVEYQLRAGEGIARVEAPRGELVYYLAAESTAHPSFVRIRTPTMLNLSAIVQLLPGLRVADVPIAIGSIDPCMTCCDRVTVLSAQSAAVLARIPLRALTTWKP